jgi:hypothetical protein
LLFSGGMSLQRLFASPWYEMSPQGTFCLIGTWHFPSPTEVSGNSHWQVEAGLTAADSRGFSWQVRRPIGLIGSPVVASDPSSVSASKRRGSCARTFPVMPCAAVTNYVRSGVEMYSGLTEYFAE